MKKIIIILLVLTGIISIFYYEIRVLIISNNINNKAVWEYNSWSYKISSDLFSWALVDNQNSILKYNLWNSYFKLWEKNNNTDNKIKHYSSALESYSGSLFIEYNEKAQENYEYVEQKLNDLLNPEEKQEDNNSEENSEEPKSKETSNEEKSTQNANNKVNQDSWEKWEESEKWDQTWENKEWSKNSEWEDSTEEWDNSEESEFKSNSWENRWDTNDNWDNLSKEQLEQIEKYADDLKKSEFYNQKYFNKKDPEQNQDIDWFFQDPFFDDSFVRWWEKDW
jgi:hypothetical protein